jgi:ABC-type branched-subunit amino acid transport system ATPase component
LAPAVVATLLDVLRGLTATGVSVLLVEQSVNTAAAIASEAMFLERGTVRFRGPVAMLAERTDLLRSVFLGRAESGAAAAAPAGDRSRPWADRPVAPALAFRGVTKRFGLVPAVSDVDLAVAPGEILGLIGANGAGKTTLLDVGSGFETPSGGRVLLGGEDVTGWSPTRRAAAGLGRMFQDTWLFPSLTVGEVVAIALDRHIDVRDPVLCALWTYEAARSERRVAARVSALLDSLSLSELTETPIVELSTGSRRIVALACALAFDARVLFLDEPSAGLAQRETEQLVPILHRLRDATGLAFIVVDHDLGLMEALADRLAFMHLGELVAEGDPPALLAHPAVIAAYVGGGPS